MDTGQVQRPTATGRSVRPGCLVVGCGCKDPRIISRRRVAFFAALAKDLGETADRSIQADPSWALVVTPSQIA